MLAEQDDRTRIALPDEQRPEIAQLTADELDRYANQLTRCLKALDTRAPIRTRVQHELADIRAEQDTRARTGQPAAQRQYDAAGLTAGELERTRCELAASLALARPESPARAPIRAQMAAIDAELAARDTPAHLNGAGGRLAVAFAAGSPGSVHADRGGD